MLENKPQSISSIKISIYFIAIIFLAYGIMPCIGSTFDSLLYLETSDQLFEFGLFQRGFRAKPPLYPFVLNLLQNNLYAVSIFNLACWTVSIILIEKSLNCFSSQTKTLTVLQTFWIAFSTPLHLVHNFIWTEPLFYVLVLVFFHYLTTNSKQRILILCTTAILLVALRHLGVLFIFGGFVSLLYSRQLSKKDAYWVLSSGMFFIGWQVFVFYLRGDMERLNHFNDVSIIDNYTQLGKSLNHLFQPLDISLLNYITPIFFTALLLFIFFTVKNVIIQSITATALATIAMIITKGDLIYDDIERYLFFIHPFLLTFILHLIYSKRKNINYLLITISILLVAYTVIRTIKNDIFWHSAFC